MEPEIYGWYLLTLSQEMKLDAELRIRITYETQGAYGE